MRGTVAKRIRREVYQDQSFRQTRKYSVSFVEKVKRVFVGKEEKGADKDGFKEVTFKKGTIFNRGLRADYQRGKKCYKGGK